MQPDSARTWAVGAIANDHVFTHAGRWVRLQHQAHHAGPWQPGDVVNDHAFTGSTWVPLPAGWRTDPTGRHQFRWWTGSSWSSRVVQTNGFQFEDPFIPAVPVPPLAVPVHHYPAPPRTGPSLVTVLDRIAWGVYGGFWLAVAIYSAAMAASENEPRYLMLTSTASLNIFLYKLTGRTRSDLNRRARRAFKKNVPYLLCGAIAAGGVWLGLHFDDPHLMLVFLFVALIALLFAWVFS